MQKLKTALLANATRQYEITGRYVEVLDAPFPFEINLYDANGGVVETIKDAEQGDQLIAGFVRMTIRSDAAQTVRLFVSMNQGGSRRISGTVVTSTLADADTLAGRAYMIARTSQGAVATVPVVGIANTSAGFNLFITSLRIVSSVQQDVQIERSFAAPGGAAPAAVGIVGKDGSGPPVGLNTWADPNAGAGGVAVLQAMVTDRLIQLDQPIMLAAGGSYLSVTGQTANTRLHAYFNAAWRAV